MGCANVLKKELNFSKENEINFEMTKFDSKDSSEDNSIEKNFSINKNNTPNCIYKIKEKKELKTNNTDGKYESNDSEFEFSGPIITLLKREVDNYKKIKKELNAYNYH